MTALVGGGATRDGLEERLAGPAQEWLEPFVWFPLLLLFTLTLGTSAAAAAARGLEHDDGDEALELAACSGGGPSLRGGMRSLIASSPFASSNDVILWVGEKPCRAVFVKVNMKTISKYKTIMNRMKILTVP